MENKIVFSYDEKKGLVHIKKDNYIKMSEIELDNLCNKLFKDNYHVEYVNEGVVITRK